MAADDLLARTPSPTHAEVARRAGRRALPVHGLLEDRRGGRGGGRRGPTTARADAASRARGRIGGRRADRPARRAGQGHRRGAVRRRPPRHRRAHAARRPVAARPGDVRARRPRRVRRRPPGARARPDRGRRARARTVFGIYETGKDQPVLADGAVRYARRGGRRARRRRGVSWPRIRDEELPITWTPLAAACSGSRPRARPGGAAHPRRTGRATCSSAAGSSRGDVDAALAGRRGHRDGHVRDVVRGARVHRARGRDGARRRRAGRGLGDDPDAVHGPRRARAHPRPADGRACGSSRAPAAAGSAASSTCRSSHCSRSRRW